MKTPGTVYWVTGFSGAGKSTIGKLFYRRLVESGRPTVFLDGDELREIFGNDLGYQAEDRKRSAFRNARLCKLISDQGIDVVCATISMFHECRQWNRENIPRYEEIYLKVPHRVRVERDRKGVYSRPDAVGVDVPAEEPLNPSCLIENDGTLSPQAIVDQIASQLNGENGF